MYLSPSQTCPQCGVEKSREVFPLIGNGVSYRAPWCEPCLASYYETHGGKAYVLATEKLCRKCATMKPLVQFGEDKITTDGKAARCLDCKRQENIDFHINNPGHAAARTAKWRRNHPEEHQASVERGREKKNKRRRALHEEHKEKDNAQNAAWYAANKEDRKKSMKAWEEANPDWHRVKSQRRRAREAHAAKYDLSEEQWQEILRAFNFHCAYCPPDCKACKNKTHALHQEHIEAVVNGGSYTLHNIVPSCQACNSKKGTGKPRKPVQPLLLTLAPARKHTPKGA